MRLALVAAVVASLVAATGAAAAVARHSRVQAERNVLQARRVLRRLDPRLVDPRTGLPRTGTAVVCVGRGRAIAAKWASFVCTISYRKVRVRVLYEAQRHNGFELHLLR